LQVVENIEKFYSDIDDVGPMSRMRQIVSSHHGGNFGDTLVMTG
jgi:hypothetical protein